MAYQVEKRPCGPCVPAFTGSGAASMHDLWRMPSDHGVLARLASADSRQKPVTRAPHSAMAPV